MPLGEYGYCCHAVNFHRSLEEGEMTLLSANPAIENSDSYNCFPSSVSVWGFGFRNEKAKQ